MAENKQFIDAQGGQELAKGAMGYTDKKVAEVNKSLEGYQPKGDYLTDDDLEGFAKTTEVSKSISDAIAASEKKIFGDGELAEAFDTIQEIGEYLKDHDDVAAGLTAEIGKKVSQEEYDADKETFETKEDAAKTYQPKGEYALKSELPGDYLTEEELEDYVKEEQLADYVKEEDMPTAVPVATIQGWFNAE